jgi:hypothetical protein
MMDIEVATAIQVIGSTSNKKQREKSERCLVDHMKTRPCELIDSLFRLATAPNTAPELVVGAAASAKRLTDGFWTEVSRPGDKAAKAKLANHIVQYISSATLPFNVVKLLSMAGGAILSRELSEGCINLDLFTGLRDMVAQQCDAGDEAALTSSLCLAHHVLKSAAARPMSAEGFAPLFAMFGDCALQVMKVTLPSGSTPFLLATKCVLRCAAIGRFTPHLLLECVHLTSQLVEHRRHAHDGTPSDEVLCRVGKIVTSAISSNAGELHQLGQETVLHSLLPLLCNATMPPREVLPAKYVSRCLASLQELLFMMDSDAFLSDTISKFFSDANVVCLLLGNLVRSYLTDSEVTEDEWKQSPEACATGVEADADAEDEPHCAEQVLLAMLGAGGSAVSGPAWELLAQLLQQNDEDAMIGALRAMGVAYDYLPKGQEHNYLDFLESMLLPIVRAETPSSLKVRRRAIWLVGMWCFVVTDTQQRRRIHDALASVIIREDDVVLFLTAVRSMENFISDDAFTAAELTSELPQVLERIGTLMVHLTEADSVKRVALLLDVLATKTDGNAVSSDSIVAALSGVVAGMLEKATEDDETNLAACIGELFRVLAQAVARCSNPPAAWHALLTSAQKATDRNNSVSLMADTEAWDVLYALVRCTTVDAIPALGGSVHDLFHYAVACADRDFEGLPAAMRTVAAVLVLMHEAQHNSPDLAAAACGAVKHLMPNIDDFDLAAALQCVAEAAFLHAPHEVAGELFDVAFSAAANAVEASSSGPFNAAAAVVGRCAQVRPELLANAQGLVHFVDAVVEQHDEMTDPYQCRIVLNAVISVASQLPGEMQEYVSQMLETETNKEQYDTVVQQYLNMWGDDGVPTPHATRLAAIVAADPYASLLTHA